MPINLIDYSGSKEDEKGVYLEELCGEEWEIPTQIDALENWLIEKGNKLPKGKYSADIGYSPREGAFGGGAVLTCNAMKIMASIGMDLYLSEYPPFEENE